VYIFVTIAASLLYIARLSCYWEVEGDVVGCSELYDSCCCWFCCVWASTVVVVWASTMVVGRIGGLLTRPSRVGFSLFRSILVSSGFASSSIVCSISSSIYSGCSSYCRTLYSSSYIDTLLLFLPTWTPLLSRYFRSLDLISVRIFLKLSTINPSYCSWKTAYRSVLVRSCSLWRYIVVYTNSTNWSLVVSFASILYPYLLALITHSCFVGSMVL
jgi:hypothetical protein